MCAGVPLLVAVGQELLCRRPPLHRFSRRAWYAPSACFAAQQRVKKLTLGVGCFCAAAGLTVESNSFGASPSPSIAPLVLAAYILPLCVNFILTALVVSRIWWMSRGAEWTLPTILRGGKRSVAFKAIMMIVESGALYFVVQLIYLVVFSLGNNAEQIMSLIAVQIYVRPVSLAYTLLTDAGAGDCADAHYHPSRPRILRGVLDEDDDHEHKYGLRTRRGSDHHRYVR